MEVLKFIFTVLFVCGLLLLGCGFYNLLFEVPKQLKRIADLLERVMKDGK